MISTNRQINPAALRPNKQSRIPRYDTITEGRDPALIEEVSGLANLQRHQSRGGGVIVAGVISAAFVLGMIAGAIIVAGLFIAANHFHH